MSSSNTARAFLGLNAAFSLFTGLGLLFAAGSAARMLFLEPAGWQPAVLRVIGAGLLVFALGLAMMAANRFVTKGAVRLISLMDIGWVVASGLLIAGFSNLLSDMGARLVVTVAIIVAVFAVGQYIGSSRMVPLMSRVDLRAVDGQVRATVKRAVDAPSDVVWAVMTDHPGYADVASNLSKVEVLAGNGVGMERRCYGNKGETWRETCDLFEDGRAYGFTVHTEATDYPYPISDLHGRWSVSAKGTGSEFSIDIEAKPKGGLLLRALFRLAARRQFTAVLIDLADAWAERMEREVVN